MSQTVLRPTPFAEDVVLDLSQRTRRVLIIIHGIRDQPAWAAYFNKAVSDKGYDCKVAPVQYSRYSSLPFIFGTGLASRRDEVLKQVREIKERNEGAIFDVFCHSNGTRLFADIVGHPDVPKFETIILAGSICQRAQVGAMAAKVKQERFWNLCGKRDRWPIAAEALRPDLFQQTGVVGFLDERVFDRYYNFAHDGALKPTFIESVVVPTLLFGENQKFEGVPEKSWLHDPATYRKIIAALFGGCVLGLRLFPWWVAIFPCLWGAYLFYSWHDGEKSTR